MPDAPLATASFADLELELETTRRVPDDQLGWRPYDKSMTLGELATHIANLLRWWQMTLTTDGFDVSQMRPPSDPPATKAGILDLWDRNAAALATWPPRRVTPTSRRRRRSAPGNTPSPPIHATSSSAGSA